MSGISIDYTALKRDALGKNQKNSYNKTASKIVISN